MPDAPDITASFKHLLTLAHNKGMDAFIPEGTDKIYSIRELQLLLS